MTSPKKNPDFIHEKIKVLGIGGAGCRAIDRMISEGLEGVDFVAIDTDLANLTGRLAEKKISIGLNVTKGLGAGSNPDIGRKAVKESKYEIEEMLKNTDMIFIACGLGGGTGSGAAPVIANMAWKMGIVTIAVITTPFSFELHDRLGRRFNTEEGLKKIKEAVDSLIVISNDKIFNVIDKKTTFKQAFAIIDNRLSLSVQGISDILIKPGDINLEFTDIKIMMCNSGIGSIGIGYGIGKKKTINATKKAIENFGLYNNLNKAKNIILSVTGGNDLTPIEVKEASFLIEDIIDKSVSYMRGMTLDETMKDDVKVIIIGTGLEE